MLPGGPALSKRFFSLIHIVNSEERSTIRILKVFFRSFRAFLFKYRDTLSLSFGNRERMILHSMEIILNLIFEELLTERESHRVHNRAYNVDPSVKCTRMLFIGFRYVCIAETSGEWQVNNRCKVATFRTHRPAETADSASNTSLILIVCVGHTSRTAVRLSGFPSAT